MLAVGVSYRQRIRAHPQGGGSYIVASEELGRVPGLMAAAGLLIDYVMTVAVSIASGVAAIASAYPSIRPATGWIGVGVIVILLAGMIMHWRRHRDQPHWRRSLVFNATGAVLSGIVFLIEGVTKFTAGAWVAIVLIAAITVTALRTRRYYVRTGQQLALRADQAATPAARPAKFAPRPPPSRPARGPEGAAADEIAEQPGQINALTIVPVEVMDRAGLQALAYAAALGQPALALHISPTTEEADRFVGYWQAWGDHLPLEVIVSPHRAVVAPLANYLRALHDQRPDLTLTIAIPELVDRHWRHRILHEHVAQRLQPILQSLPRVVVTTVPFQLAD